MSQIKIINKLTYFRNARGIMNLGIGPELPLYLEVEVDAGSGLVCIGNQQMASVLYAMSAENISWTADGTISTTTMRDL